MNRIKRLRTLNGIKQADLAKMLQVSQAALSGYETGKFEASLDVYIDLADIFGVSLDYLLGRTDERNPAPMWEAPVPALTDDEQALVAQFRELNPEGQTAALGALRLFTAMPEYKKHPVSQPVQEIG